MRVGGKPCSLVLNRATMLRNYCRQLLLLFLLPAQGLPRPLPKQPWLLPCTSHWHHCLPPHLPGYRIPVYPFSTRNAKIWRVPACTIPYFRHSSLDNLHTPPGSWQGPWCHRFYHSLDSCSFHHMLRFSHREGKAVFGSLMFFLK